MGEDKGVVHLLDYGAGNVRSVRNAIRKCGYTVVDITKPEDIANAKKLVFPGVGSFGSAMKFLNDKGFAEPLKEYIKQDKPYLGICLGLQTLFQSSEESSGVAGLGVIPGVIERFKVEKQHLSVPSIGWNGIRAIKSSKLIGKDMNDKRVYFVHSFRAPLTDEIKDWVLTTTEYGETYVSAVQKGNIMATQFHPEKSGKVGLQIFQNFLDDNIKHLEFEEMKGNQAISMSKRIIACLDVRSNDDGDLVVTKGESYDVREKPAETYRDGEPYDEAALKKQKLNAKGKVRNLGKPVELASRYYDEGADEVTFLNITSFRSEPLEDTPMLEVLEKASENVFVPLTIGGGIRDYKDSNGKHYSALDVAARYFRAGADKVSIGSDAVYAAETLMANEMQRTEQSAIEKISHVYGRQAVVISIDPRRVYLDTQQAIDEAHGLGYTVVEVQDLRPNKSGKISCWYQCTVKGGREGRAVDAVQLARCVEILGAGEILLNSIDMDGKNNGFDSGLVNAVCSNVTLPVIASSGAGKPEHFKAIFDATRCEAALAAGIFHRKEVPISAVKTHCAEKGVPIRIA